MNFAKLSLPTSRDWTEKRPLELPKGQLWRKK